MSPAPPILDASRSNPVPRPHPWMGPSILFVAALMLAVLWRFQPSGQFFYPRCAFYELTGWKCPGCGGTRATHALLHGNVSGAWNDNPLAVLLAPLGAWLLAREVTGRSTGRWWPMPRPPFWVWLAAGGMAAAFGVLRNCI